jgi:anti-sigma B factor antagonist
MLTSAADGVPFPGAVTLRVSGDVDLDQMDELRDSIVACGDMVTPIVVVDMTEVTFIGSSGLRALIGAKAILEAKDLRFCVDDCSEIVERVLKVTGLRDNFERSSQVVAADDDDIVA